MWGMPYVLPLPGHDGREPYKGAGDLRALLEGYLKIGCLV